MRNKLGYGIFGFISFILGGFVMYYFNNYSFAYRVDNTIDTNIITNNNSNNGDIVDSGLSEAVSKVYNAVVMINTYKNNKVTNTGSGFVYKKDDQYGYIMTNHHVVSGGDRITMFLSNDREIEGVVLGSDEYLDLAVVRIDSSDVLSVVSLGKNSECRLGNQVFTVGSPLGYNYRGTVTNGIISGLNRLVEVSVNSSNEDFVMEVIQTNAAVNPGNSGGPLVNANGEVIGIISLKLVKDSVEGMGFAILIDDAMNYIDFLESGKKIERPVLGITMYNAKDSYKLGNEYNRVIDSNITDGVIIMEVNKNSNASDSKLQKGDIITKINNKKVINSAYLKYMLYKFHINDTIELTYLRNGKENSVQVLLSNK